MTKTKRKNRQENTLSAKRPRLRNLRVLFPVAVAAVLLTLPGCGSSTPPESDAAAKKEETPRGWIAKKAGATPGYVLFSPLLSGTTYLIDEDGKVVHTWESEYATGQWVYGSDRYNAPGRNWSYDIAFNRVVNLPPFTPMAVTTEDIISW